MTKIVQEAPDSSRLDYNSAHARVRQRFTISHESPIISYMREEAARRKLFIDKQVTYRRDDQSSAGVNREEIEATSSVPCF